MRESGYMMAYSALVLMATLAVCGWFSADATSVFQSAQAAGAFAAATILAVTMLDLFVWCAKKCLSRPP